MSGVGEHFTRGDRGDFVKYSRRAGMVSVKAMSRYLVLNGVKCSCPVLKVLVLTQMLRGLENLQIGVNGLPVQLVRAELGSREGGVLSSAEVFLNILPQSCRLSTGPPSIRMGFSSAFVPRTVPWNLELSPVLLCFRLSATSNRSASY